MHKLPGWYALCTDHSMKNRESLTIREKQIFDYAKESVDNDLIEISDYARNAGFMVKTYMTNSVADRINENDILPVMKMLYRLLEKSFGYQPVMNFSYIRLSDGSSYEIGLCSVLILGKEPVIIVTESG